jgi:hypothetical protein
MEAAEVSTEMAQEAGETAVEGAHGAGPGQPSGHGFRDAADRPDDVAARRVHGRAQPAHGEPGAQRRSRRPTRTRPIVRRRQTSCSSRSRAPIRTWLKRSIATPPTRSMYLAYQPIVPAGPVAQAVQAATPGAPVNSNAGPVSAAAVVASARTRQVLSVAVYHPVALRAAAAHTTRSCTARRTDSGRVWRWATASLPP